MRVNSEIARHTMDKGPCMLVERISPGQNLRTTVFARISERLPIEGCVIEAEISRRSQSDHEDEEHNVIKRKTTKKMQ